MGEPHKRLSEAFVSGGLDRAIDHLVDNLIEAGNLWLARGGEDGVVIYTHEAIVEYLRKFRSDWR